MFDRENPLPLYIQVREDIRAQIESGALSPGDRLLFEDDLATQYGVSCVTIKHALRDLVAAGLIIRIKNKGTFVSPRRVNSTGNLQRTRTLALIIPDIEDLFISEIYRGAADVARKRGYRIAILSSDRQVDQEASNIRDLGKRGEEGAIIFPNWGRTNSEQIFELKKAKFPFVLVNRYFKDIKTNYVVVDNRAGALEAVEHLIRLGHRSIACIGWVECTAVEDRLAGYRLALGRHGIPYDENIVRSILDEGDGRYASVEPASGGYREMKALLNANPRPTAVFAVSDRLAVGAMRAIAEAGLRMPGDIAVVGFDDLRYAADLDLTTVRQPAFETGQKAAEILIGEDQDSGKSVPGKYQQIVLPVELIVRGSCGGRR
ncbi:MAG: GntR family transcriptional regulator [Bryobacteraceae bacterium]